MQIAIIGAGNIGGTLARQLAASGHKVRLGVRDSGAQRVLDLVSDIGTGIEATSPSQAVAGADVTVFAVPGAAVAEMLPEISAALNRKVIIDATNNMTPGSSLNSLQVFSSAVPTASVYRAFNTLGWENFANPMFGSVQADLFYCGSAGDGQKLVEQVIEAVGLRPIYVGGPDQVGVVDGVAALWFALVFGQKHPRRLAFKVLAD